MILEGAYDGNYSVQVTRDGYNAKNETITCTAGQTLYHAVTLSAASSLLLPIIVIVVVVIVVVVAVIWWFKLRKPNEQEEYSDLQASL